MTIAPPPMIAAPVPRERPRLIKARMPGSRAIANSHARMIRNRKWLISEYSHRASRNTPARMNTVTADFRTDRWSSRMVTSP